MNPQVEAYFSKEGKWAAAYQLLRQIIAENKDLKEDYKWMHPCYTFQGKNIVLIHGFKDYCAILFHKGALLKDPEGILVQQTRHVQAARQIRFTRIEEIITLSSFIKAYIKEAIENERQGKQVQKKTVADYPVPIEFQGRLDEDPALLKAFKALTPGRQKAYLFYFNQAKQTKTRAARIERYYTHILQGKGMDDK